MKRGQTWSTDIVLAVVIFIGTMFLFYAIVGTATEPPTDFLSEEAKTLSVILSSPEQNYSFVVGNEVDEPSLEEILRTNYTFLKQQLGILNDFCIYFEDEEGKVVYLNESYPGLGYENITVGSQVCGRPIP